MLINFDLMQKKKTTYKSKINSFVLFYMCANKEKHINLIPKKK